MFTIPLAVYIEKMLFENALMYMVFADLVTFTCSFSLPYLTVSNVAKMSNII